MSIARSPFAWIPICHPFRTASSTASWISSWFIVRIP